MSKRGTTVRSALLGLALVLAVCVLLGGCLFKPVTVTARRFVLAPTCPPAGASASRLPLSVGVGLVKMPAYLLQNKMTIRKGTNEVDYLEGAFWAERLDLSFQRALAANLSAALPADQVRLSSWERNEVAVVVQVNLEQFEVDDRGVGTLLAWWRIANPGGDTTLKSGQTRLSKAGPPPGLDPRNLAATLSDLTAEFSQVIAQAIRESAPRK